MRNKIINGTVALAMLFLMMWDVNPVMAQLPTRDPHMPGYVSSRELPDGAVTRPTLMEILL